MCLKQVFWNLGIAFPWMCFIWLVCHLDLNYMEAHTVSLLSLCVYLEYCLSFDFLFIKSTIEPWFDITSLFNHLIHSCLPAYGSQISFRFQIQVLRKWQKYYKKHEICLSLKILNMFKFKLGWNCLSFKGNLKE